MWSSDWPGMVHTATASPSWSLLSSALGAHEVFGSAADRPAVVTADHAASVAGPRALIGRGEVIEPAGPD